MSTIKRLGAQFRRELIEHRRSVIYTPIIIAALIFLMVLVGSFGNGAFKVDNHALHINAFKQLYEKQGQAMLYTAHQGWLFAFYGMMHIALAIVSFAYALGCLFDERRDRSTLFWRSLPIRDWETVAVKAAFLLIAIPISYMVTLMILQIAIALLLAVLCTVHGLSATELIFTSLPFFRAQAWQFSSQWITSLWLLPIFAWCMLCSGYCKNRPFLTAILLPGIVLALFSAIDLVKLFSLAKGTGIAGFIKTEFFLRILEGFSPAHSHNFSDGAHKIVEFGPILERLMSTRMLAGIVVGLALLALCAYIRRYREDAAV